MKLRNSAKKIAKNVPVLGRVIKQRNHLAKQLKDLAKEKNRVEEQYLSEIANKVGISRALAKVHLKKLREAGLVKTTVVTLEDEARALRYYELCDFEIHLSSEKLKEDK